MSAPAVNFILTNGQAGGQPADIDKIGGLMTTGIATTATSTTLAYLLNTTLELYSVTDIERYGINSAYDTANNVQVWTTVRNFFLRNPKGKLWFRMAAQTTTLSQLGDYTLSHAKQLLRDAHRLRYIPGIIAHGRYDVVTPLRSAFDLHRAWPPSNTG